MKVVMLVAFVLGLTACVMGTEPARTAQTAMGPVLADSSSMTLYTFDRDVPGKSNCNGQCAANWPPLKADGTSQPSGNWSVVTRDDGSKQWAYKGKPLYYFAMDKAAGDKTGEGRGNGAWHVAKP